MALILTFVTVAAFALVSGDSITESPRRFDEFSRDNLDIIDRQFDGTIDFRADTKENASLADVLNFYSSKMLTDEWAAIKRGKIVSSGCERDVYEYVKGLRDGAMWALKMDDSTGRYTSGFFWGNNYWSGSQTQCLNIIPDMPRNLFKLNVSEPITRQSVDSSLKRRRAVEVKAMSPSSKLGYEHGKITFESLPPFVPAFFTLKLYLNFSLAMATPKVRIIYLGMCMPLSCTNNDIVKIFEHVSGKSKSVELTVDNVRSQHQTYNLWNDSIFRVLVIVTLLVTILLIAGTVYDYHLAALELKRRDQISLAAYDMNRLDRQMRKPLSLDLDKTDSYANNNRLNNSAETLKDADCFANLGICSQLLLSFSIRINLRTICDKNVGADTIPTIHGIRSLSMAWVILGHTCIVLFKYSDNMEFRKLMEREFLFQTITNGAYSVDSFFLISGLLVSFLYFRTNAKKTWVSYTAGMTAVQESVMQFIGMMIYRFARLTVPYFYVLGIVLVSMKWYQFNAVFEPPADDYINCEKYWWRNILYINTLYPVEEMCMLWSWYLGDDTLFYTVGIMVLILSLRRLRLAAIMLLVFMVSSLSITGYIAYENNHKPNTDDPLSLFDKIYDKPWTRLGPYLIGMAVGYLLFKTNCKINMSKPFVWAGWTISTACLLGLLFGFYDVQLTRLQAAALSSSSHSIWALSIAWMVIACSTGHGGFMTKILSWPALYPFSRVTYCAYLIHPMCIRFLTMTLDQPVHLTKDVTTSIYFGQVVISYLFSFVISVAFEAPVVSMLRILSPKKKQNA